MQGCYSNVLFFGIFMVLCVAIWARTLQDGRGISEVLPNHENHNRVSRGISDFMTNLFSKEGPGKPVFTALSGIANLIRKEGKNDQESICSNPMVSLLVSSVDIGQELSPLKVLNPVSSVARKSKCQLLLDMIDSGANLGDRNSTIGKMYYGLKNKIFKSTVT